VETARTPAAIVLRVGGLAQFWCTKAKTFSQSAAGVSIISQVVKVAYRMFKLSSTTVAFSGPAETKSESDSVQVPIESIQHSKSETLIA
jgi:hypothetical protein